MFFLSSARRISSGCQFSSRYRNPHSQGNLFLTFSHYNLDSLGAVIHRSFLTCYAVCSPYYVAILRILSVVSRTHVITSLPITSLLVLSWATFLVAKVCLIKYPTTAVVRKVANNIVYIIFIIFVIRTHGISTGSEADDPQFCVIRMVGKIFDILSRMNWFKVKRWVHTILITNY